MEAAEGAKPERFAASPWAELTAAPIKDFGTTPDGDERPVHATAGRFDSRRSLRFCLGRNAPRSVIKGRPDKKACLHRRQTFWQPAAHGALLVSRCLPAHKGQPKLMLSRHYAEMAPPRAQRAIRPAHEAPEGRLRGRAGFLRFARLLRVNNVAAFAGALGLVQGQVGAFVERVEGFSRRGEQCRARAATDFQIAHAQA